MFQQVLKSLTVAVALGLMFAVQAAVASPTGEDVLGVGVTRTSVPLVSENTTGQNQISQPAAKLVSENAAGMTRVSQPSVRLVSENTTGQNHPVSAQPALASTRNGFDWSDAGIGAAVVFGTMLLGTASVVTIRRHRTTLAH
jgi:hypothetical protein